MVVMLSKRRWLGSGRPPGSLAPVTERAYHPFQARPLAAPRRSPVIIPHSSDSGPTTPASNIEARSGIVAAELRGVRKRFAGAWALRGIELLINAGESVCLLGPNGSGKTTLLRVLATATRPTIGEARVFGFSTTAEGGDVRRRVGLLSHRTFLYGELTALENLRFAAAMYGLVRDEVSLRQALADVGLDYATNHRVRGFSQGMAQRLSLARATLHRPPLLLLDEPYSALDAGGLAVLDRYLERFVEQGGTTIIVTHQVERGLAACRRAVALNAGRVTYDGPAEGFLASPEAASVGDWG